MPLNCDDKPTRVVPEKVNVYSSWKKIGRVKALLQFFCAKVFWGELFQLLKNRRFSIERFKLLLRNGCNQQQRYVMLRKWWKQKIQSNENVTVYTYWMASDALAVTRLKAKGFKFIHVTRCHGFDLYDYTTTAMYLPFQETILKSVDKIIPICEDGRRYLNEKYENLYQNKIIVSRLGTIDWGVNKKINSCPQLTIVSCSNLIPVKRVHLMLEALKYVSCPIKWIHFGDGILRDELQEKTKELPENVSFTFYGYINNRLLLQWYQEHSVDFFVNTSESEGVPVSIMEALSFGIPVVATNVGGTGEIIQDGVNGYLLEKDFNVQQLANLIHQIRDQDVEKIQEMRRIARDTWLSNYEAKKNYTEFYHIIAKL